MMFTPVSFALAGYGVRGHLAGNTIRLFREHVRDVLQYEHYSDDWDEEDDASGWRPRYD